MEATIALALSLWAVTAGGAEATPQNGPAATAPAAQVARRTTPPQGGGYGYSPYAPAAPGMRMPPGPMPGAGQYYMGMDRPELYNGSQYPPTREYNGQPVRSPQVPPYLAHHPPYQMFKAPQFHHPMYHHPASHIPYYPPNWVKPQGEPYDQFWHPVQLYTGTGDLFPHTEYYPTYHGHYKFDAYNWEHLMLQRHAIQRIGGDPKNPYDNRWVRALYNRLGLGSQNVPLPEDEEEQLDVLDPGQAPLPVLPQPTDEGASLPTRTRQSRELPTIRSATSQAPVREVRPVETARQEPVAEQPQPRVAEQSPRETTPMFVVPTEEDVFSIAEPVSTREESTGEAPRLDMPTAEQPAQNNDFLQSEAPVEPSPELHLNLGSLERTLPIRKRRTSVHAGGGMTHVAGEDSPKSTTRPNLTRRALDGSVLDGQEEPIKLQIEDQVRGEEPSEDQQETVKLSLPLVRRLPSVGSSDSGVRTVNHEEPVRNTRVYQAPQPKN